MTSPFHAFSYGALHFWIVSPGSIITDERTGAKETVDDRSYVMKGNVVWITQTVADYLKAEIARRNKRLDA